MASPVMGVKYLEGGFRNSTRLVWLYVYWCCLPFLNSFFHAGTQVIFKRTVRRDARWVKNGLTRCVLTNYMTASLLFLFLKRHHHEKSIKPVSASWQQLNWICWLNWQNPADDGLRTFNAINLSASHELKATSCELQASSFKLRATSSEPRDTKYELRAKRYEI